MKNFPTNVKILSAAHMLVPRTIRISSSRHHVLIIRLNQKSIYTLAGERLESHRGNATLIPEGSDYTAESIDKSNEYLAVRFHGDGMEHFEILHVDDLTEASAVHGELCRALIFEDEKSRLRALSLFYRLLSLLSEARGRESYVSPQKLALIRPALNHVEQNIFSPDLKIGELHKLCNISDVYFRKIFILYTGTSPHSYVEEKRLCRAREIINEGEVARVADIAMAVGYTDALYFSRIYKKRFAEAPSKSRRRAVEK